MLYRSYIAYSRVGFKKISASHKFHILQLKVGLCTLSYRYFFFNSPYKSFNLLSSYRCLHTSENQELTNKLLNNDHYDDDENGTLEDYEEMLIHSAASDTILEGNESDHLKSSETYNNSQGNKFSNPAVNLVNDILEILPTDGTGIRLTTITPALDVEAVNELYGSVRDFVQLFPHRFRCYQVKESDGSFRWYVSRAKTMMMTTCLLDGENNNVKNTFNKSSNFSSVEKIKVNLIDYHVEVTEKMKLDVLAKLQNLLPKDKAINTTGLLFNLPKEFQNSIRALGGGLLRLLKDATAVEYIDLSEDTNLVSVKGFLLSQGIPTYHQQERSIKNSSNLPVAPAPEYADDAWNVELEMDNDDSNLTILDDNTEGSDPDGDFFLSDTSATAQVPCNVLQSILEVPPAPPKPPERLEKRKTPPPLAQNHKGTLTSQGRMSPEEILKAHTAVALLRGRRSPSEMLDLFVECIPTIYMSVQKIKLTDALARILGPQNNLHKVIKIYFYYFDRDKSNDTVRLKPTLQHPRLGVANTLYESRVNKISDSTSLHRKLQGTNLTRVFPVLQTPLRTGSEILNTKKKMFPTIKSPLETNTNVESISSEQFALLGAISHDRYLDTSEWAEAAGVSISTINSFIKDTSQNHYVLKSSLAEKDETKYLWRLRPYWLAPGCTEELGTDNSTEAVAVARHLRPIWISVERLLQKLGPSERDNILKDAERYGGLDVWLRRFGRFCWVDETGKKVRKYCANAELDDLTHACIIYLQTSLPTEYVKLEDFIKEEKSSREENCGKKNCTPSGIKNLLLYGLTILQRKIDKKIDHKAFSAQESHNEHEDLYLFLSRHSQRLEIKIEADALMVARRSLFRKKK